MMDAIPDPQLELDFESESNFDIRDIDLDELIRELEKEIDEEQYPNADDFIMVNIDSE